MKKFGIFMCSLALVGMMFTSCDQKGQGNGDVNLDEVIEDGFYVAGAATGSEKLVVDYMMAVGLNEVDRKKRDGMYEKYVALEANKDFTLLHYVAGEETLYSAELETFNTGGEGDQPNVTLWKGQLETGADVPAMKVAESGLYHIVLDLNTNGDLQYPQIIVAPVQWGTRGINGDWGFKAMSTPEFNRTSMTFVSEKVTVEVGCDFKFAYGGGWKIQLDDAGKVKANTNLGNDATEDKLALMPNDLVPNGKNIALGRGVWVINLTWKLANGDIKRSYEAKFDLVETLPYADPSTFVAGFSGSMFESQWSDPAGETLAVFNAGETKIDDETTKSGTYVYDIASIKLAAGEFKVRYNGGWLGAGNKELKIEGATFEGADNFVVSTDATYSVKFVVTWDGDASAAKEIKVIFTAL